MVSARSPKIALPGQTRSEAMAVTRKVYIHVSHFECLYEKWQQD